MKKQLDLIKKTIQILDSIHYDNYSEGRTSAFLEYIKGTRADEETLIERIIFPRFAEQVLGFKLGESLWSQSSGQVARGKPDFIPVDTRTHPFVFDIKGTDTVDLSKHYKDKRKYIEDNELRYLVLTNMRDLDVYTEERVGEVEDYNFNFVQLYKNYKENLKLVLDKENTRRFLNFIERFSYRELTLEDKVRLIAEAKPWKGITELNSELLTERLRAIVKILYEDIKNRRKELAQILESDPDKAKKIAQEIELIGSEISRGREAKETTPELFQEMLDAPEKSLYGRALDSFFYRIAYFTMTRLLLARTWEDIGFIDQSLYDGGFKRWYENFNYEISRVLRNAFGFAAERYPWLFNVDNNYSWYEPLDNTLTQSLYELSNFNLTGLNQDVLGSIYEEYIDRIDKKNKGQYYTPREIVSFIWDRVGYTNSKAFFWQFEGKRVPRFVFDPATGSGGFLVEAARRLREESGIDFNEFQDLFEVYRGILYYIFGAEISIFPYYITEVNLLIQLTPILKRMMELKPAFKEQTPLGVVRVDALSLYNFENVLYKEDSEKILEDKTTNILPLDSQKKAVFDKIRKKFNGNFSYCCANPPYIGEKGHEELFRETLRRFPYWQEYHKGKMNYLYWFIILGLSKLREWGKLGFITTHDWPIADGASILRKYILKDALVKEMIFFEEVKIFEHAKGQYNMVFVLQKLTDLAKANKGKSSQEYRNDNRIKIVKVKVANKDLPGKSIRENLAFLTKHITKHINKPEYEDRFIKVFWSGIRQRELPNDGGAWNSIFVPQAEKSIFKKIEKASALLSEVLEPKEGIVPGIDRVTEENIKLLPVDKVIGEGIKPGDGVFVLSHKEAEQLKVTLKDEEILVRSYRNSHISPYFVDIPAKEDFIIYIDKKIDIDNYPGVKMHLEKYKEILKARLERYESRGYKESYFWYRLNRPRDKHILKREKIVVSNWGNDWQPYAYQTGDFFEKRDVTFFIIKEGVKESVFYFLALLNSHLIRYWMVQKAKQKGYMRQNQQKQIPIRRIDFNNPKEVEMHDKIVGKIKEIRENMAVLSKYSKYFKGTRLTKVEFDAPLPEVNEEAIIRELPSEKLYSLRTHPDIKVEKPKEVKDTSFYLSKIGKSALILSGDTELKLKAKDGSTLRLTGSYELIKLIAELLKDWKGESWAKIKEALLIPESTDGYESHKAAILKKVENLRSQVTQIQCEIDRMVYKLYGLSGEEIKIVEGKI